MSRASYILAFCNIFGISGFLSCNDLLLQGNLKAHDSAEYVRVNDDKDTIFYESLTDSTMAIGEDREGKTSCRLYASARLALKSKPRLTSDRKLLIELLLPLPGCNFKEGFVLASEVESSLPPSQSISKSERAFLSTIAYAEGTGDVYNYIFSHASFTSFDDHPRKRKCSSSGLCSNAAGRYQFLSGTWDQLAKRTGVRDFSPESQDIMCLALIRQVDASDDVANAHNYASFERAVYSLSGKWASLPGASYGQPTKPMSEIWRYFQSQL